MHGVDRARVQGCLADLTSRMRVKFVLQGPIGDGAHSIESRLLFRPDLSIVSYAGSDIQNRSHNYFCNILTHYSLKL